MDIAIIIGILLGWACVIACLILEGNKLTAFVSLSSFLLVIGGSFGATIVGFKLKELGSIMKVFINTIKPPVIDFPQLIAEMKELAVQARRGGVLSLEESIAKQNDDIIKSGLQLVVDGADSEVIQKVLETKASIKEESSTKAAKFFEGLGGYTPTLGIIGTVLGLVKVLGHLSEPEKLGEGIAEAFIATLYGISAANLIFLPLSAKIKANIASYRMYSEMVQEGILSIHAGDNPIMLEEKLKAYVIGGVAVKSEKEEGNTEEAEGEVENAYA